MQDLVMVWQQQFSCMMILYSAVFLWAKSCYNNVISCFSVQFYPSYFMWCFFLYLTGFNCGEAVNFAIGDWFPLGSVASRRYALLNRMPLLPQEELLCKEARLLFASLDLEDLEQSYPDLISQCSIKVSFVNLMRFQHRARWCLVKSRQCNADSTFFHGTILCNICKRDCYVAYLNCQCSFHPVCLRHGIAYFIKSQFLFSFQILLEVHSVSGLIDDNIGFKQI